MDDLKYLPSLGAEVASPLLDDFVFSLPLESVWFAFFLFYSPCFMNLPPHIFPSCNSSEGCHLEAWTHSCLT